MTDLQIQMGLPSKPKKVLVETWGCQMNVADSEKMMGLLKRENYETTENPEDADLVLLNTCHIREKAKHKVMSRLGVLNAIKLKNPSMKIAVAGCVAQAEGMKLIKEAPTIDVLLGPGKIEDLPRLIRENSDNNMTAVSIGFKAGEKVDEHEVSSDTTPPAPLSGKNEISRFVNIQQGCNNFCTFCVVPMTRGREISRPIEEIVREVRAFVSGGAREITLLGQNVNSYGSDLGSSKLFVELLNKVCEVEQLLSLRFTTSNPHDFSYELADLFRTQPKLGRYMHLPVQSGDNEVLERMRRKVTVEDFLNKISWLRNIDPEFALSTDLIVGFPGETDQQFENTLKLVEKSEFSFVFSFKYSPRKGTAAARFREQVDEKVMDYRLAELNRVQNAISMRQNLNEIGKLRTVLFAYRSKKNPKVFYGRSKQFRLVRVESKEDLAGQELLVKIKDANSTALVADLVDEF